MSIPFNPIHDGPNMTGMSALQIVDEWQFFPVMTSFPA